LAAREKLGTDVQLSLELYHDPEVEDEYPTLYVRQRNYQERILEMIESVREEYEGMLAKKTGWFHVTTDFRSPR
jgi:hypothetical protein